MEKCKNKTCSNNQKEYCEGYCGTCYSDLTRIREHNKQQEEETKDELD